MISSANFTDVASSQVPNDLLFLAKTKLEKDLLQSFLMSPRDIKNNWTLSTSILAAAELPSVSAIQLGVDQVRTTSFTGLRDELLTRRLTAKLNERGTPLRVLITSIAAGPMAVLCSLQIRQKLGDSIKIYFHDVNGRDQVKTLDQSGQTFDFVIAPDGPFWLSAGEFRSFYQPWIPLFSEDQFVLANRGINLKKAKRIWVYPFSSAQLQFRAWVPAKRKSKSNVMERGWLASIREEPCAASDISRLAAVLAHDDLIITWEPLATEIIRQSTGGNSGSAKLVKVNEEPFPVVFTMFANVSNPDTKALYETFSECFISEWNYCRVNLRHTWDLLRSNTEYLAYFGAGAGMDVANLISSPTSDFNFKPDLAPQSQYDQNHPSINDRSARFERIVQVEDSGKWEEKRGLGINRELLKIRYQGRESQVFSRNLFSVFLCFFQSPFGAYKTVEEIREWIIRNEDSSVRDIDETVDNDDEQFNISPEEIQKRAMNIRGSVPDHRLSNSGTQSRIRKVQELLSKSAIGVLLKSKKGSGYNLHLEGDGSSTLR